MFIDVGLERFYKKNRYNPPSPSRISHDHKDYIHSFSLPLRCLYPPLCIVFSQNPVLRQSPILPHMKWQRREILAIVHI
jgi:hypothetical protein